MKDREALRRIHARNLYSKAWNNLAIPEPLLVAADKVLCKAFRVHGRCCRGRRDHFTPNVGLIDPARWI